MAQNLKPKSTLNRVSQRSRPLENTCASGENIIAFRGLSRFSEPSRTCAETPPKCAMIAPAVVGRQKPRQWVLQYRVVEPGEANQPPDFRKGLTDYVGYLQRVPLDSRVVLRQIHPPSQRTETLFTSHYLWKWSTYGQGIERNEFTKSLNSAAVNETRRSGLAAAGTDATGLCSVELSGTPPSKYVL